MGTLNISPQTPSGSLDQFFDKDYQMQSFKGFISEAAKTGMAATTDNATITELFPALAFNLKYKPLNGPDFQKWVFQLQPKLKRNWKKTFPVVSNVDAANELINNLPAMDQKKVSEKFENAVGIYKWILGIHSSRSIKKVMWGYRQKPPGVKDSNHAGDIFLYYKDGGILGVSLKGGTPKSKEPKLNSYVGTTLEKEPIKNAYRGDAVKELQDELWDRVYSKIPGINEIASKSDYINKKQEIRKLYVQWDDQNKELSKELYHEQALVSREKVISVLNSIPTEAVKQWIWEEFRLEKKGQEVPLVLVKAVRNTAEVKGDSLVALHPMITKHHARINKNSVQEWFIDVFAGAEQLTLRMTIRSDAGVRLEKKLSDLGQLGKFHQLKLQYSGTE
jgi:hypothetical protein